MDITTAAPPIAQKTYPIPPKYQKFIHKEIHLLEDTGLISKSLSLWASLVIIVPKKPDPCTLKNKFHLVLDYHLQNKSINAEHNGNNVISYYPLPNITDLLASLWKYKLFSLLDLRSGYHHIGLTPEVKLKMVFATTNGKWYRNVVPFRICSISGVFCYLISQVLSGLHLCFAYLDDILMYSTSWEEHLQHLQIIFNCLNWQN